MTSDKLITSNMDIGQSLNQAAKNYSAGNYEEANVIYSKILADNPSNPIALHFSGLLAYEKGQTKIAIKFIEEAIYFKSNYIEAYYNLGNIFRWIGKFDKAIISFGKAVRLDPNYAEAYFEIATLFARQGRIKQAIGGYQKVLTLKPQYAKAHNYLGLAYKAINRPKKAIDAFRHAVDINSNYTEALMNLALSYKKLGDLESAIETYEKSLVIDPSQAWVHNNLGNALREKGRNEEALKSYRKAIEIDPKIENTNHFLSALSGKTTDRAPQKYVQRIFDAYADSFEHDLLQNLSYDVPKLLKAKLEKLGLLNNKFKKAVDLGCGTGLAGAQFKAFVNYFVGIDLSSRMLVEARKKKIYDELFVNEILDGLEEINTNFELFIATDVFVYIGDLSSLFECIYKHSENGACFIFSTEHCEKGNFVLNPTGRYAHSENYITSISRSVGFQLINFNRIKLRKEHNNWIIGALYILKKI